MQKYRLGKSQQSETCSDNKQEGSFNASGYITMKMTIYDAQMQMTIHDAQSFFNGFLILSSLFQITKRFRGVMGISLVKSMMELRVR